MVFRRRFSRRKFKRRTRRFRRFRKKRSRRAVAMSPELKIDDSVTSALTPDSTGGVIQRMVILTQGTGANFRIGNKVTIKSVNVRFTLFVDPSMVNQTAICRVAVFLDTQTVIGALPNLDEVYVNGDDPLSYRDQASSGRFKQLFSKTFQLNKGGAGLPCKILLYGHTFRPGLNVRFSGTGGNSVSKNMLFYVVQTDSLTGTPVTLNTNERIVWTDL